MVTEIERAPQELRFDFEENEILHIDNGLVQIHSALASDQFEIERIQHKLVVEQNIDVNSILTPKIGDQYLIIATKGVGVFVHDKDEGNDKIPKNNLELWGLENPYTTGNESDAIYVAKYQAHGMTFLVQYLSPNSVSSHHRHHVATEHFFSPQGTEHALIWYNGYKVLPMNGHRQISLEEPHAVFSLDKPTIGFILQNTDKFEHDPSGLERPTIEFLKEQSRSAGVFAA